MRRSVERVRGTLLVAVPDSEPAQAVRRFARLGSAVSVYGANRFGSNLAVLDFLNLGSSLSMRSFARFGDSTSVFSGARFGSCLSRTCACCTDHERKNLSTARVRLIILRKPSKLEFNVFLC